MFDVAPTELLLVAIVALVVIGPKDLPKAMRFVGFWVGRARGVMRQFRSGFDTMVREAELEEMEKKWAAENARIMSEHPQPSSLPAPEPQVIEHDDGEAPPVMVEQPAFAPDPPPVLPAPIAIDAAVVEPSPALAPAATPAPAPTPAADLFASEPAVIATPDGDDAAPVKKPRKRKAAS